MKISEIDAAPGRLQLLSLAAVTAAASVTSAGTEHWRAAAGVLRGDGGEQIGALAAAAATRRATANERGDGLASIRCSRR